MILYLISIVSVFGTSLNRESDTLLPLSSSLLYLQEIAQVHLTQSNEAAVDAKLKAEEDKRLAAEEAAKQAAAEEARIAAEEAANEEAERIVGECKRSKPNLDLYSFHKNFLDKYQAAAVCYSNGGSLASILCERENEFLTAAFEGQQFWIGANDDAEEGTFVWEDGNRFNYTNWDFRQPNNWSRYPGASWGDGEDCVMVNEDGEWDDNLCSSTYQFACKYTDPEIGAAAAAEEAARIDEELKLDENLYSIHTSYKNATDASADCEDLGGTLASILSAKENEFLTKAFGGEDFWIGGNDEDEEGTFVWEDGSIFCYTNWL